MSLDVALHSKFGPRQIDRGKYWEPSSQVRQHVLPRRRTMNWALESRLQDHDPIGEFLFQ